MHDDPIVFSIKNRASLSIIVLCVLAVIISI